MMRLILFVFVVCCIAYLSPTRKRTDVTAQVDAALGGVESLAAVASSALGQRVMEEVVRRPRAPAADRLANAPERPYR